MQANTAYWGMLVGSQIFHIFMCKTRNSSLLSHGIFQNSQIWAGIFIEIILVRSVLPIPCSESEPVILQGILIVYVPWLNTILSSNSFPGMFWP